MNLHDGIENGSIMQQIRTKVAIIKILAFITTLAATLLVAVLFVVGVAIARKDISGRSAQ